ncbi:MAG TPA: cellulase family glycosylhydrolase [Ktedonobacteraceae bacterium]|nr:cellulase family glycosylhydrolase [Ktedonobacteraceae bacterium]
MRRVLTARILGALLLVVLSSVGLFVFGPLGGIFHGSVRAARASSLPFHQYADGPYTVSGNKIIGADGKQYLFHGVGRDGLEFECTGDPYFDAGHLAFIGPGNNTAGFNWFGNTVRIPLSEGFWLHGNPSQGCSAAQYQSLVSQVVNTVTNTLHLNAILDLMWDDAGGQVAGAGAGFMLPDNDSVTFWSQAAGAYKSNSNVLFELYNEPHPQFPNAQTNWSCWQNGCQVSDNTTAPPSTYTYNGVGMQSLVNAVRATGARNLVLVAGVDWGFDLSQVSTYRINDSAGNLVWDTHPYPYVEKMPSYWDAAFGNLSASAPVFSAENGEYDCGTSYMSQLLDYFDAHSISYTSWAWYVSGAPPCGYPQLISNYQGTPASSMAVLIYQRLLSYAGATPQPVPSPTPNLPPGPVSMNWYFAEGHIGQSFQEYLTIDNPDPVNKCNVNITYLLSSGAPVTRSIVVNQSTRATENVNGDLGVPSNSSVAKDVSTIVQVTNGSSCKGVVAERPMYFSNVFGVSSGHDTLGATHLGQSFYFADMASMSGFRDFITILNPPGGQPAHITVTYYGGGNVLGTDTATVAPGTRGTITPHVTQHSAAFVSSDQPVMVERPAYFAGFNGGSAGSVTGAVTMVGAPQLGNDWLFAEGYTGGGFQENFVIANLDTSANATANVTITLEFSNGSTGTYNVSVPTKSITVWNVNAVAPNQNVSAEIKSSGANIVVERQMFFHYNHPGNGRDLQAQGGTDVVGQAGPSAHSSYSFAEGYTNGGYDEWLTIQNPTSSGETVWVTLVNGQGRSASFAVGVVAHSRATVDIVRAVMQYFCAPGAPAACWEVSMTAQTTDGTTFVAERPMYFNASGSQGGTDVIGYVGG